MLYDSPVEKNFNILTHTGRRLFQKNGFNQVGNKPLPPHEISQSRVTPSAIYTKGIRKFGMSGISEAGYGRLYVNPKGLSYSGAGSQGAAGSSRTRIGYAGAGSSGASGSSRTRIGYAGAGSFGAAGSRSRTHSGVGYAGAGSYGASGIAPKPRRLLTDAYINDNPSQRTLAKIGMNGIFDDITGAFSQVASGIVKTVTSEGTAAANKAVVNAINPPPKPPPPPIVQTVAQALDTEKTLGISLDKILLGGAALVGGYFLLRK